MPKRRASPSKSASRKESINPTETVGTPRAGEAGGDTASGVTDPVAGVLSEQASVVQAATPGQDVRGMP